MSVSTSTPSEDNETSITVKKVSLSLKRDQQIEEMSLTVPPSSLQRMPEYTDPAILAAKPLVCRYTRDELFKLRQVPLAQKRPDYLDTAYNNSNGVWDPELWHRSCYDGSNENGEVTYKRRSGDPRERLRKEDGIVLSPQRRSFNSGCFVPLKENQRSNRPHSPIGGKSDSQFRDIPPGGRRIGSGRILSRDVPWDFHEKDGDEFSFRKERRDDREERFERRSYSRDFDLNKEKDKHGGRSSRFTERRRTDSREEEPEWFSGGPVSQHETIELRGFDDVDNEKNSKGKRHSLPKRRRERRNSEQNENKPPPPVDAAEKNDTENDIVVVDEENNITSNCDTLQTPTEEHFNTMDQNMFNLDDILKCDTIAGLLRNGVDSGGGDTGGSRFSQFFTRESPVKQSDSRRSSFQDDHIIRNLLSDIAEPNINIPSDSDLYFAPISPAASIGGPNAHHSVQKPINIMEMLQRGKQSNIEVPADKVVSLEEVEARFLHHGRNEQVPNTRLSSTSDNDTAAFERLVAQMKGDSVISNGSGLSKAPPINIFETMQDEIPRNSQILGPSSPNALHNDMAFKFQQIQNHVQAQQRQQAQKDMMNKLLNAGLPRQQLRTSPLPDVAINQSRDLLNRPEAQAILHAMHQRIPSPRELQQHTQAIMQNALIKKKLEEQRENYKRRQEQQNSARGVSPAKHTHSPTPLAFTPTSVLRKMTAEKDDGCNKTLPQGRPVTGMKPNLLQSQTWNLQQQLKQPAGRPIVKANTSYQSQQSQGSHDIQQFYQQQQQQQRLYGQQQQPSRKAGQQQFSSQTGASSSSHQSLHNHIHHQYQFSSNPQQFQHLTQHQLRAQHQQHQAPQQTQQQSLYGNKPNIHQHWSHQHHPMLTGGHTYDNRSLHPMGSRGSASNNGGELSPIANQLARWFPPELLEKARAGQVPSMPNSTIAQHAVNLEEMERHTAPPIHN